MHRVDLARWRSVYVYDATGRRVRKVVERNGLISEERIISTASRSSGAEMAVVCSSSARLCTSWITKPRVAILESAHDRERQSPTWPPYPGSATNSATTSILPRLELDERRLGDFLRGVQFRLERPALTREPNAVEVGAKCHRYTGKEKDEETPSTITAHDIMCPGPGRWTATDPIGLKDGGNLYSYVSNRPVTLLDPNGKSGRPNDQTHAYSRREYHEDEFEPEVANPGFTPSIPIASGRGQPLYTASDDEDRWVEPGRPGLLEEAHAPGPDPHPDRPRGVVSDKAIAIMKAKWPTLKRTGMHVGLLFITGATGGVAEALGAGNRSHRRGGRRHARDRPRDHRTGRRKGCSNGSGGGCRREEGAKQAAFGGLFGYAFESIGANCAAIRAEQQQSAQ